MHTRLQPPVGRVGISYPFGFLLLCLTLLVTLWAAPATAQTTGKLAGRVVDAQSGESLPGANVIVVGTFRGASTDIDGYYTINNIPPGSYTVEVSFIGYRKLIVTSVQVRLNLTTQQTFRLSAEDVQLNEIVVEATEPLIQADLVSSRAVISAEEIALLPVESVAQVVNLQAGVVAGHFRGGRSGEVGYLIDGVSINDPFDNSTPLQLENASVSAVEVITGTFDAEYGQAMSGIVNVVSKDGANQFEGYASGYLGGYATAHSDLFPNLSGTKAPLGIRNVQLNLSGPVGLRGLSFFLTGRLYDDQGYLYGQRIYTPQTDFDKGFNGAPTTDSLGRYTFTNLGDGSFVSMNSSMHLTGQGKLTYNRPSIKLSYLLAREQNESKGYDYAYRYNPDGQVTNYGTSWLNQASLTHVLGSNTYYTLKYSGTFANYKGYVYEDPFDPRYVSPTQGIPTTAYTFRTGGQASYRYNRKTTSQVGQLKFVSQLSRQHAFGAGLEGRFHELLNEGRSLRVPNERDELGGAAFLPLYPPENSYDNQGYTVRPYELSAYVQDKAEYDILNLSVGLRLDYFDPNTTVPVDLRNPQPVVKDENNNDIGANPNFPGYGERRPAKTSVQLSPRLGASFPISDAGAIHFAYGHFFQTPNLSNLYQNPNFLLVSGAGLSSLLGNPELKPQRTIQYEAGLQQVILPNVVLDFSFYYRDIRDLLGSEVNSIYGEAIAYGRYTNLSYGNVRGFVATLDKRFSDYFSFQVDYTLQQARGDASNPLQSFQNQQSDPPVQSARRPLALDWDQRHTLNTQITTGKPGNWTVGLIYVIGSGLPYTRDVLFSQSGLRAPNASRRPITNGIDLKADKRFRIGGLNLNTYAIIYNLLDLRTAYNVYASSGRPDVDLNAIRVINSGAVINGLNSYDDFINNPTFYAAPRQLRVGLSFGF